MKQQQAFVIRCAPSGISRLDELIDAKQIVIGWSETRDLLFDPVLDREGFKRQLIATHPGYQDNPYSLGQATGYLWRFLREMSVGDYAIVPIPKAFYLGRITSDALYLEDRVKDDTAIRRDVEWLNEGKPILRDYCSAGLVSILKYQGTCVNATRLLEDLETTLALAQKKQRPNFKTQLNGNLKTQVANFLTASGSYLDDRQFEELVRQLLLGLGATTSEIPSRQKYKKSLADVDVEANFVHLGLQVYVQVKKHKDRSGKHAVEQIIEAIKIDNPDGSSPIFGWVITSGIFDEDAHKLANENGIRVIDGDELAEMIVAVGLDTFI
jgi:predicted Mrr-cat superfamily restriction endonuclease